MPTWNSVVNYFRTKMIQVERDKINKYGRGLLGCTIKVRDE